MPVVGSGVTLEVDTRRAHELRDDDALGAVDDEGAVRRHHREIAEEDAVRAGLLDLAGLAHDQPGRDAERRGVGHIALAAIDLRNARVDLGALLILTLRHAASTVHRIADRR